MTNLTADDGGGRYRNIPVNLEPNSDKYHREKKQQVEKPEKKIEQITKNPAKIRKKPLGRKIADSFRGEDASTVLEFIVFETVLPTVKDLLIDMISQGAQRLIRGDDYKPRSSARRSSGRPTYTSYTPYNRMSSEPRTRATVRRDDHDFGELVFESRGEAEEILDRMADLIEMYDVVTVSELYRFVGIQRPFTDENWGWNNLRDARVRMISGGNYVLILPNPIYIK